jgi:hypothetical protein
MTQFGTASSSSRLRGLGLLRDFQLAEPRKNFRLACAVVLVGILISSLSPERLRAQDQQPQGTTPDANKPAESKPGGTRPTTPAPEPANPGLEARKQGAKPALPPAPAEKFAPPIKEKQ